MKQLQHALAKRTALLRRANSHKIGYPIHSIVLLACLFTPLCWPQQYQRQVGMAWDFSTAPDTLGWSPISPLSGFGLRNGTLTFTATSKVAIFYSPSISVATAALQRVEIVMSSDTGSAAKVFWAPATSGIYGGFQPGDENDFVLVGDSGFHSYVLPIDTSSANNIYRLRLDVPEGATVAIKSVALASLTEPAGSGVSPSWQFSGNNGALGWLLFQGTADTSVSGGRLRIRTYTNTTILAPKAQVTNKQEWLSLLGRVTQSSLDSPWMEFSWISTANNGGPTTIYFPLLADSSDHVYNQNVGGGSGWWSTVSQLGIVVPENTTVEIASIQLSSSPQGPADLAVDAVGSATSLVRAGSAFQFSCRVSNRGSQPVQQLSVNLTLPSDGSVKVVASPAVPSSLANGYPVTLVWTLSAAQSGEIPISLLATSPFGGRAQASVTVLVNPAVAAKPFSYVPPPLPVSSNYDLGIYYFPGWQPYAHWDPIRSFPERMPALGYYAEGDPRVADWHIKWAVEHGIKFFAVDWYWQQSEWPNSFLKAFLSSSYHSYAKFCIAYANDQASDTAGSVSEFLRITQAWIDEYFSRAEYYRINQTPVVVIINPQQLEANLGGSTKPALDAARQLARSAGFSGIYFIAGGGTAASQLSQISADGYDALSAYNYPRAGTSDPDQSPYSAMVTGYESTWDSILAGSSLPYIIPTSPGFDARPWLSVSTSSLLMRSGSTAGQFQQMLQAAKSRIDSGKAPPVVLVEAWNELGEGSYVEPTVGRGFTYLDAIRSVFVDNSPHTDLAPHDAGLPLVEALPSTALWTFTDASDLLPWQNAPGPPFYSYAANVSNSQVIDNQWTFTTNGAADLMRQSFEVSALDYSGVAIRMAVSADAVVSVYWGAKDAQGPSASRTQGFTAKAGATQTYTLALSGNAGWRGIVNSLRITITGSGTSKVNVALESIGFVPSSSTASLGLSKAQVRFTSTAGSPAAPQTISVANLAGASLSWAAAASAVWLAVSPASGTAPGSLVVAANPAGLAAGVYQAAITLTAPGAANSPQTIPVTLWVIPSPAPPPAQPIITLVANAFGDTPSIAPNTWVEIKGSNLIPAADSRIWQGADFLNNLMPTQLDGVSVTVNGKSAYVYYISPTQVNILTPPDAMQGPVQVELTNGGGSYAVTVPAQQYSPSVFVFGGGPYVTAEHADGALVGPANLYPGLTTPARPGETIVMFGNGFGSTSSPIVSGNPTQSGSLPVLPVVKVGGVDALVQFAGLVSPGQFQFNVVVPVSAPDGDNTLTATYNGFNTQAGVLLTVKH